METKHARRINGSAVAILVLSILVLLLILGTIMWEDLIYRVFGDTVGSTVEQIVIFGGLYLAPLLGLLDVIAGLIALSFERKRTPAYKGMSTIITGNVLGVLAILLGVLGILTGFRWLTIMLYF